MGRRHRYGNGQPSGGVTPTRGRARRRLAVQLIGAPHVAALTAQTITFSLPGYDLVGGTIPLTGTASSGLPVAYASATEDICTIDADLVELIDQGTCTVIASQAGDEEYDPAPDVQASVLAKLAQTIDFSLPASGLVGASVPLSGTATSGLDVAYASTTPGICAVDGATLDLLTAGTCDVTASQPGDDAWTPAEDVAASMLVELPPYTSPDGAKLGRYAFNGYVKTLAIDQETGVTYVGGDFTQVGIRTGAVAVVDPPGSGSDAPPGRQPGGRRQRNRHPPGRLDGLLHHRHRGLGQRRWRPPPGRRPHDGRRRRRHDLARGRPNAAPASSRRGTWATASSGGPSCPATDRGCPRWA